MSPDTLERMNVSEISIGPRFRTDLGDIISLARSISTIGLLHPVVVGKDGQLIAGQRRLEACKKLGWETVPVHTVDLADVLRGQFDENALRKNFTVSEAVAIARALEPLERDEARKRMVSGRPSEESAQGRARDKVADHLFMSHDTLEKAETIVDSAERKGGVYAKILERVDTGRTSVNKGYNQVLWNEKKQNIEATPIPAKLNVQIFNEDFQNNKLPDNSVDLILTDPPYTKEYLHLWEPLGKVAARVLKPGRFLATYSGQAHLPGVLAALSKHLEYFWTMALIHGGKGHELIRHHGIYCTWKPILLFAKPPMPTKLGITDSIHGTGPEKNLHAWQQNHHEFEELLEKFSLPGQTVLDPFAGSGSTILACVNLKRHCIAYEVDPETYALLEKRFRN